MQLHQKNIRSKISWFQNPLKKKEVVRIKVASFQVILESRQWFIYDFFSRQLLKNTISSWNFKLYKKSSPVISFPIQFLLIQKNCLTSNCIYLIFDYLGYARTSNNKYWDSLQIIAPELSAIYGMRLFNLSHYLFFSVLCFVLKLCLLK